MLQPIRLYGGLYSLAHGNIDENACILNSDLDKIRLTPDVSERICFVKSRECLFSRVLIIPPQSEFDPRTVQPIASHYTH